MFYIMISYDSHKNLIISHATFLERNRLQNITVIMQNITVITAKYNGKSIKILQNITVIPAKYNGKFLEIVTKK